MSESELIAAMREVLSCGPGVRVGIGDDAAVLGADPAWLMAHDMLVEDVHFRWASHSFADLGHKALAVNVSDIAAMGGAPVAAIVGLAGPPDVLSPAHIREMYRAMDTLARATGCSVVGGDISRARETIVGVTVLGRMAPGTAPVLRRGAVVGDVVCLTGAVGASAAGRLLLDGAVPRGGPDDGRLIGAHLRPTPLVRRGADLAALPVHAMLDISDGVAIDAERLAVASGVRIRLDLERLPVAPGVAVVAAARGMSPALFAATGGEDYQLLVSVSADSAAACAGELWTIGSVVPGVPGVELCVDGRPVQVERLGWDHLDPPAGPPAP